MTANSTGFGKKGIVVTFCQIVCHYPLILINLSFFTQFRDLGSLLPNVTTLSVMRCRLTSLDGTFALPNLEYLFASDNLVKDPSPVGACTRIRYVDLSE